MPDTRDTREPARTARHASLHYVSCADAGIIRVKRGKGFGYRLPNGHWLTNAAELERIRKLALPPAWTDVWVCADRHGHLQATGFDAKGRKQYRYDSRWRLARDEVKYHDLLEFASKLPRLRQQLRRDRARNGLRRENVLATVVSVMARTGARVGNERYQLENGSFGLTTLLDRHTRLKGSSVQFAFKGKGGKPYRATVRDAALARIVKRCRDIPGQRLFQYLDPTGAYQCIGSGDVNEYVKQISGVRFTAKTFRTWLANVLFLAELREKEVAVAPSGRKRRLNEALQSVADQLGNTPAICRKSYVHPALIDAFLNDELPFNPRQKRAGLSSDECDLIAVLHGLQRMQAAA